MPPTRRPADTDVNAVYTAEDRLERWFSLGTVTVFGTSWALEPEVRFARVPDVQAYVDRVLSHLDALGWAMPVRGTPGPIPPVHVRRRAGARKAHYEEGRSTIALPEAEHGHSWALREAVVLHELAHHLHFHCVHPPGAVPGRLEGEQGPAHGPVFRCTLLALFRAAGHPTAATLLSIAFAEEGLA